MASINFQVDSYRYSVFTQADHGLVWDGKHLKVRGLIVCNGGGYRTVIYALSDNSYIPENRYHESTKRVFIFGGDRQFEWYMDMLRNEKPVYCRARPNRRISLNASPCLQALSR
jgi:hypothetical protein